MSCRDTFANSAITSYVQCTTPADVPEHVVLSTFHSLLRTGKNVEGQAPTASEANDVLEHQTFLVRNDANLSEARKNSILRRLQSAQAQVASGQVPDRATLYAWQHLSGEVEVHRLQRAANPAATAAADADREQRRQDRVVLIGAKNAAESSRRDALIARNHRGTVNDRITGRPIPMLASGLNDQDEFEAPSPDGTRTTTYEVLGRPKIALVRDDTTGTVTPRVTIRLRHDQVHFSTITVDAATTVQVTRLID